MELFLCHIMLCRSACSYCSEQQLQNLLPVGQEEVLVEGPCDLKPQALKQIGL